MQIAFSPEAKEQIAELYRYIAQEASPDIAFRYVNGVISYCESLVLFPNRGQLRNDVRSGLRVTHFRGKTSIAFVVIEDRVEILGVFHGGREYVQRLRK